MKKIESLDLNVQVKHADIKKQNFIKKKKLKVINV